MILPPPQQESGPLAEGFEPGIFNIFYNHTNKNYLDKCETLKLYSQTRLYNNKNYNVGLMLIFISKGDNQKQ